MCFLLKTHGCRLECVPEIVVGECRQDHAQGIGFAVKCGGAGCEDALARRAAPELDDLEFLFSYAFARDDTRVAVGARVGSFGCVRDAGDARKGWHTR